MIFPSNICKAKAEDALTDALHQCAHRSRSLMRTTENFKLMGISAEKEKVEILSETFPVLIR